MKLTKVAIRRYRSIEEMDAFPVEEDITCLVGKNESGKTAVLSALTKSCSLQGDLFQFDETLDYPSKLHKERRKGDAKIPVTVLTYDLDENEVEVVENSLGLGAISGRTVEITTFYRGEPSWSLTIDEPAIVRNLAGNLSLPSAPQAQVDSSQSVAELVSVLNNLDDPNSEAEAVLDRVARWENGSFEDEAVKLLNPYRPRFLYFSEYDIMPGEVNVEELLKRRSDDELTRGEEAFFSLLHLAGVELRDFLETDSSEHRTREVENASNMITDEVFEYWTQNDDLQIRLQVEKNERNETIIQIRVYNPKHRTSVPFDERSRGFVWFFSFLAFFSEVEQESEYPIILLLDEPGLSLHAKAQADLLRLIEERLATEYQVLYTTHSPFLVQPSHLERVRTVVDTEKHGTVVSADILAADSETVFPLLAAMGVDLTQTLMIGQNVLLVEGPSDVIFLSFLNDALQKAGRTGLDSRWVVTPAGGITKLPVFLSMFSANKVNVAVLADSASHNQAEKRKLAEAGRLSGGQIVYVGEVLGRDEGDVEDLFTDGVYLKLVNEAFAGALRNSPIRTNDLPKGGRLVSRVESFFKENNINDGKLNHYSPAGALLRGTLAKTKVPPSTLDTAEKLFTEINRFLPEK